MKTIHSFQYQDWYRDELHKYKVFTDTVKNTIQNLLLDSKINFLSISSTTKTINSSQEKKRKKITNSFKEITDLACIRILTYIQRDGIELERLICKSFKVNEKYSSGDLEQPINDTFSYRSMIYICEFGEYREKLPEFKQYKGMLFEIQVRSVFQHILLEFEHGRNNIFAETLPSNLKIRLNLVAGLLESADHELDSVTNDFAKQAKKVIRNSKAKDMQIEINPTSLKEYLNEKIKKINKTQFYLNENPKLLKQIIREMNDFGLNTLNDIDTILSKQFIDSTEKYITATNEIGLLRNAMLYIDIENYFRNAWKKRWLLAEKSPVNLIKQKYGSDKIMEIFNEHGVSIYPDTIINKS